MFDVLRQTLAQRRRRTLVRPKAAAVLVPIIDDGDPRRLLLTRRTNHLPTHKGQVAFPGGRLENDETPIEAALREAHEEIGLPASHVEVLGLLDDFPTIHNDTTVTPVVARIANLPPLTPEPGEVARIFDIPLSILLASESWRIDTVRHQKRQWPMYYCDHDGETLWGLSAYITLHMLDQSPLSMPFDFTS